MNESLSLIAQAELENERRLAEARNQILETNLTRIRNEYAHSNKLRKDFILQTLESLSNDLRFDPEVAKAIREKENLSQVELSKKFGWDPEDGQNRLSGYEVGRMRPSYCPKPRGLSKLYLEWLKEKGYNPHNI